MNMETAKFQLSLTLLFDSLPIIEPQQLAKNIASIESISTEVIVDVTVQLSNYLCASIEFESHRLKLTGFPVPVSTYLRDMTIGFSDLSPSEKAALDAHKSYIICDYEGDDPSVIEQLISLYKAADGVRDRGLLGVLDLGAWSCKTPKMLKNMLSKKMLQSDRESIANELINIVKIAKDDEYIWFCTKGFHRFNSQDYAYLGAASEEEFSSDIFGSFFDVINFINESKMVIEAGDKVLYECRYGSQMSLLLRNIYEYVDYLNSPLGTLAIERMTIDPSVDKNFQSNHL